MFKVKVFINNRQIDEIWIQNIERHKANKAPDYWYDVIRPTNHNDITYLHTRTEGWKVLLKKALEAMIEKEGVEVKKTIFKDEIE